jgi:biopolymer transport protein ExbD
LDFIRKKREKPHIEITPLIDIVFLLLIFFMISSNFIKPVIKMDLPKALFEEKLEKVDLVITIDGAGKIFINKEPVLIENLKIKLEERMAKLGKYDVIFNGDKSIGYDTFVNILDISKLAGATSFSVEHKNE